MLAGHGSVDLGSGQIGVTEQVLHGAKICATFEQMGREAVPQGVRKVATRFPDHGADAACPHRPTSQPDPVRSPASGPASIGRPGRYSDAPIPGPADRHPTCLLPLADHGHHVTADVVDGERRQLRNPETGRIEGVDQGTIARPSGVVGSIVSMA